MIINNKQRDKTKGGTSAAAAAAACDCGTDKPVSILGRYTVVGSPAWGALWGSQCLQASNCSCVE